jgi:class 3 adenylate cyclase
MDYSATGDVVNEASCLEEANKEFCTEVLVSTDALRLVPRGDRGELTLGPPMQVKVKSKRRELTAHAMTAV